tara:strand:- start:23437 stop:23973 length:537 start_codon:yes stop_codon:yes gene_type:complete
MRKLFFIVCLCLTLASCKKESKKDKHVNYVVDTSSFVEVSDVHTVDYEGLKPIFNKEDNKIYVINFWATWCLPCVKELPYFEKINQDYKDENVEVILVSLDFPKQKQTRLIPYINKKKLQSEVIHFDDVNEQFWIADINESWTGAIPATLIYNKDKRKFYEQSFAFEELKKEIELFIK